MRQTTGTRKSAHFPISKTQLKTQTVVEGSLPLALVAIFQTCANAPTNGGQPYQTPTTKARIS